MKEEKKTGWQILPVLALAGLVLMLGIVTTRDLSSDKTSRQEPAQDVKRVDRPDYVGLAQSLGPVVVNISTIYNGPGPEETSPFGQGGPSTEFFGHHSNPAPQPVRSLGSGFIIDPNGIILTNNHVVQDAAKIIVKLSDQKELQAEVVGRDEETDIALLKINPEGTLPVAKMGDSDRLEVGEWIAAVGSPFGLDKTITGGIVSAKGRQLGAGPYDNFIQTDVSINPGSSGGPLVNMRGEIVGINTAILSRTGSNIGIGFAIAINGVKELLPELRANGKITRGWLGVSVQTVTPDIAESLGLRQSRGALVVRVTKYGPAEEAGIKVGDLIIEYEGKRIHQANALPQMVARTPLDQKVELKILRDGKEETLSAKTGRLDGEGPTASSASASKEVKKEREDLGLRVRNVESQMAQSLGLDRPEGVFVAEVDPQGAAAEADLRHGDVILRIDRKPIRNVSDYHKTLAEAAKGKKMLFLVSRSGSPFFLALMPPSGARG